jgi:hypothetical protein
MPLTFKAIGRARERILSFGQEGTGKTGDALTIARGLPDVTFHWIDNDNSLDRLLETEFADLGVMRENGDLTGDDGNIQLWRPEDWPEHQNVFVELFGDKSEGKDATVGVDDWIVLDNGSLPWDAVQDWAAEDAYDMTREELTEQKADAGRAKGAKGLLVFDGNMDYQGKINPQYRRYLGRHLTRPPCHLYVTADMAQLDDRDGDKQTKNLYGKYGVKPRSQKRLGQSMQTVLLKETTKQGTFKVTSIKDRGRGLLVNHVVSDFEDGGFFKDYVREVAGWKPAKY